MDYLLFEKLCKEQGTSPYALSQKLGLSKGNTSNWKNGGNPSVEVLCKLADELNCTTDSLLGRNSCNINNCVNNNVMCNNASIKVTNGNDYNKNIHNEISEELARILSNLPLRERSKLISMIYDFEEEYNKDK